MSINLTNRPSVCSLDTLAPTPARGLCHVLGLSTQYGQGVIVKRLRIKRVRLKTILQNALFASLLVSANANAQQTSTANTTANAPTRVDVATGEELGKVVTRTAPAMMLSLRESTIASQIASSIIKVNVVTGDNVEQGDPLVELDCSDYTLALESAQAQMQAAEARSALASSQLKRLKKLKQSRNASEEQINQRQAELAIARADSLSQKLNIKNRRVNIQRCLVSAPYAGVISQVFAHEGSFANIGSPLVNILDTQRRELNAAVTDSYYPGLASSSQILFTYQQKTYPTSIRTTLPRINTSTSSRQVRLQLDSNKLEVPIGASGRIQWQIDHRYLSSIYLVSRDGRRGYFIAKDNQAHFIEVKDLLADGQARLQDADEQQIIINNFQGLQHGDAIVINP